MIQQFSWPASPALALPPHNSQYWQEPPLPKYIVLDGREIVKPFYDKVKNLPVAPTVLFSNTEMLNSILQALAYNACAEIMLEMEVLDMVGAMVGGFWGADVEVVAYGMVEFGQRLLQVLRAMGAYRNGYLNYQHGQWLGLDIALERLEVPELNTLAGRHWKFGPPSSIEHEEQALPAGVVTDPSGVYTNLTEDPSVQVMPVWMKSLSR